jgi:predicted RNase H-like HicB family nuclease
MGSSSEDGRGLKRTVFTFTGQFQKRGNVVFASCDHAPIVTHGADEDEALDRLEQAITLYLQTLVARGEIELAVQRGKLRVAKGEVPTSGLILPRLDKVDSGFVAEMAMATV